MTTAAVVATEGRALNISLLRMFEFLDLNGGPDTVAEVELQLHSGQWLTIAAGGKRTFSSPDRPPFATYEVAMDHDPPRFWKRYTDDVGLLFSNVPRLLITHYAIRNGGVAQCEYRRHEPTPPPPPKTTFALPPCCPGWYK